MLVEDPIKARLLILLDMTIKLNINGDVRSGEFPWIETEPIIRDFDLITVDNFLLENSISIA